VKISIDGVIVGMQPDSLNWQEPTAMGSDGDGAPVRAPNWTCTLGFSKLTTVQYQSWWAAWQDGELHTVSLPHPATGVLTDYDLYVASFTPRMDTRDSCEAAMSGADIVLTRVQVT
jgi:hypothetical protein